MKPVLFICGAMAAAVLSGCSSSSSSTGTKGTRDRAGAQPPGAPRVPVSAAVLNKNTPATLPEQITLPPGQLIAPGTYRIVVVDGNTVLVHETDPRKILTSPAVQVIASDPMGTDLSLQPAMLPQEVAEEIVRNRAQTDVALRALTAVLAEQKRQGEELRRLRGSNQQPPQGGDQAPKPGAANTGDSTAPNAGGGK